MPYIFRQHIDYLRFSSSFSKQLCCWLVVLLLTSVCTTINAADNGMSQFSTDRFSTSDGLPSRIIINLVQAKDQRLWVHSSLGLSLFDGRSFRHVKSIDGISTRDVLSLQVDSQKNVWVVLDHSEYEKQLYRFDGNQFELFAVIPFRSQYVFNIDQEKQLPLVVAKHNGQDHAVVLDYQGGIWSATTEKVEKLDQQAIDYRRSNLFYRNGQFQLISQRFHCTGLITGVDCVANESEVINSTVTETGRLVQLTAGLLQVSQGGLNQPIKSINVPSIDPLTSFVHSVDSERVHFGDTNQLFEWNHNKQILNRLHDHLEQSIKPFIMTMSDRQGHHWIASEQGLNRINSTQWSVHKRDTGLWEDEVTTIKQHPDGTIFVGHNTAITLIKNGIKRQITLPIDDLKHVRILDAVAVEEGFVFSARAAGAGFISLSGVVSMASAPAAQQMKVGYMVANFQDDTYVSAETGIYQFANTQFLKVHDLNNAGSMSRRFKSIGDSVYLTVNGGILANSGKGWQKIYQSQWLDKVDIAYDLIRLPNNELLLATNEGLRRTQKGETIGPPTGLETLDQHSVYAISEKDGAIYFATNNGLYRWLDGQLLNINTNNGLPANETNRSALTWIDDQLWLGTTDGLVVFEDIKRLKHGEISKLVVKSIEVDGKTYPLEKLNELVAEKPDLQFNLDYVNLAKSNQIDFRYRLSPIQESWKTQTSSSNPIVNFNQLGVGDYFFQAQVLIGGTVTSDIYLPINVTQPLSDYLPKLLIALFSLVLLAALVGALMFYRKHARFDRLTNVLNKSVMIDLIDKEIRKAGRRQHSFSVLFVDLNRFKQLNDRYGHLFGDEVIKEIVEQMNQVTRPSDSVARFGGDEFVFLIRSVRSEAELDLIIGRIKQAIAQRFTINNIDITVNASIGAVSYRTEHRNALHMLEQADMAMYQSKKNDENNVVHFFRNRRGS